MKDLCKFYTLNHEAYYHAILAVQAGELPFKETDSRSSMIVGGAATQLIARDRPTHYRPTTDIDVILSRYSTNSERRRWAEAVASDLKNRGYSAVGSLTNHGSEARFTGLNPDLILHLDCTSRPYFDRHEMRFGAEFERASEEVIEDLKVRSQAPQDIIANKISRVETVLSYKSATFNDNQRKFYSAIIAGDFDSIVVPDFDLELARVLRKRAVNIETLAREGFDNVKSLIADYKIDKDFYDIALIISVCRDKGIKLNKAEFLHHLRLLKS